MRGVSIIIFALSAVMLVGFVAFASYYFGVWPKPSLTVDDPAISEWLRGEDVVVHRKGFKPNLASPQMFLDEGQRVDGGCQWHTRLSLQGSDPGPRVARTLATNYGTYDRLVK